MVCREREIDDPLIATHSEGMLGCYVQLAGFSLSLPFKRAYSNQHQSVRATDNISRDAASQLHLMAILFHVLLETLSRISSSSSPTLSPQSHKARGTGPTHGVQGASQRASICVSIFILPRAARGEPSE